MVSLRERMSVQEFDNQSEKQEFLRAMCNGEVEVPFENGGMGIGITEEDLVNAVGDAGGFGVYTGAMPAGRKIFKMDPEMQNAKNLEQMNHNEINRVAADFLKRYETRIRGINFMEILPSYAATRDAALESGAFDISLVGAGMDEKLPARMAEANAELKKKEPERELYYWPIVSSALAARAYYHRFAKRGKQPDTLRPPDGYYVELPKNPLGYTAGGHLGFPKNKPINPDDFNPEAILAGIRKFDETSPVVLAGGIAYRDQIKALLDMGYSGFSMGTRFLLTQESGMPDETLKSKYLNPNIGVVLDQNSPTGYYSSRLDVPYTERTTNTIRHAIKCCVDCVGDICEYRKNVSVSENTNYCIYRELIKALLGEEYGLFFSGGQIVVMRNDDVYQNEEGLYIPYVEETVGHTFTNDSPAALAS
ncbi:MAG: nitronate monooxygenase [Kiritimatiellales bacterium]|nr:nitronate monooxygenase [Kiritimatiellales bacterium]